MKTLFYQSAHGLGRILIKPFMQVTTLPRGEEGQGRCFSDDQNKPCIILVEKKRAMDDIAIQMAAKAAGIKTIEIVAVPAMNDKQIERFFHQRQASSEHPEKDVLLPVSVFWGRVPTRASGFFQTFTAQNWAVVGFFKRLVTVLTQAKHVYCYIGHDMPLSKALLAGTVDEKKTYLQACTTQYVRQKETLIGPDLSHQRTMAGKVLQQPAVQAMVHAPGQDSAKLEKKATRYIKEIASDYSYSVVRFFDVFLTWLWEKLYQGVDVKGIERLQNVAETHELVYVPCHRSHIDYLLLSYVIYRQGLMPPHVAAGINLNFPIVGKLLRGAGAFFIRRQFRDNPLYKVTLEAYIHEMCREGFSIEYFIEGGRSRTGLLLQPRPGMLAMTLKASVDTVDKPIVFVPVYIGYEKLFESHSYIKELYGAKKEKETLGALFSTRKKLKQKHGKVFLNIGEPFALSDIYRPSEDQTQAEFRQCVNDAGNRIMMEINASATVTPMHLMATALLASAKYALLSEQLASQMSFLHRLCELPRYEQSLSIHTSDFDEAVIHAKDLHLIGTNEVEGANIILLDQAGQVSATFLRNNILHVFILPSLIASMLIVSEKMTEKRLKAICHRLYPYLKAELFLPWQEDELESVIDQILAILHAQNSITHRALFFRPADEGTEGYYALALLARVAEGNIQRFYITALLLHQADNWAYTEDTLVDACVRLSKRFSLLHACHEPDFLDKNLFKTFISQLIDRDLIECNAQGELSDTKGLQSVIDYAAYVLSPAARRSVGHVVQGATL